MCSMNTVFWAARAILWGDVQNGCLVMWLVKRCGLWRDVKNGNQGCLVKNGHTRAIVLYQSSSGYVQWPMPNTCSTWLKNILIFCCKWASLSCVVSNANLHCWLSLICCRWASLSSVVSDSKHWYNLCDLSGDSEWRSEDSRLTVQETLGHGGGS